MDMTDYKIIVLQLSLTETYLIETYLARSGTQVNNTVTIKVLF